jgi:hypothetical protein
MTDQQHEMVCAAVDAVHAASARGETKIQLLPPPEWTLGDAAWERAVVERLNMVGHAKQIRGPRC